MSKNLFLLKKHSVSSTHKTEELLWELSIKNLKNIKFINFIIPRHIERTETIIKELSNINFMIHTHEPERKIPNDTDIYIVNSYGKTKSFYNICKNIF